MKIGILTLPLHYNYGGILQAYALQEFLRREGHEVVLLDRQRNKSDENPGARFYRMLCRKVMYRNMYRYTSRHLHTTPPLRSEEALRQAADGLDAIVVGSDQVWRLSMIKGVETNYFLDFAPSPCRKIAYAASFGTDRWEGSEELTQRIRTLIASFQALSVREEEGVTLCREVLGQEAVHVSDPTLLFDHTFYEALLPKTSHAPTGCLFHYLLGNKKQHRPLVEALAQKLRLTPYTANAHPEFHIGKFAFAHYPTPDRWIEGISRAAFIVTDSFHGTVFALLFNKPFVVLENQSGGLSRIHSLLGRYGLESRLMNAAQLLDMPANALFTLPYSTINPRIADDRHFSAEFLLRALTNPCL